MSVVSPPVYDRAVTRMLLNDAATVPNVMSALAEISASAGPDDLVLIFLAGHGEQVDGKFYFAPADFGTRDPAMFARAMKEAAEYTNTHHAETVDLISKFTGIDAAMVRTMTRTQAGTTLDPGLIQPVIDASAKYKDIPTSFAARDIILAGLA